MHRNGLGRVLPTTLMRYKFTPNIYHLNRVLAGVHVHGVMNASTCVLKPGNSGK